MFKNIIILYVFLVPTLFADTLLIESGIERNTLVELYTSEGCSSCPPAEEYLNNLKNNGELWKTWIPVAFHVDYWDYIGWKDRYATKEFGQRQSLYASLKRASTVYTPAFMVNGSSWRPGIFSRSLKKDKTSAGNLKVVVNEKSIKAQFEPVNKSKNTLKLNVAILGMGLSSNIERGENEGRHAKHEFVAVGFDTKISNNNQWTMNLPELHYSDARKYALAVWVSYLNDPTPLQVVGSLFSGYKNN